ncbi:hypothetical protein [Brachybacterium sacelli]|uniref:Uncharacterized protein n=1 Tax=Brachybacterium sacelli TaxID=173364 RepID=A0ABS4X4W6_9MICO|nr:hypothetical protein [Brachybacterium sacelli]MBP2383288.1 hypothetical protein [Brachybacterium sacelli]
MTNQISTNIDELIAQERRRAADRIAKLKHAAAAEQRRVDARVVELLREEHSDLYERLTQLSADHLRTQRSKRAKRAKKAASRSKGVVDGPSEQAVDPEPEEETPWNG